MFVRGQTYLRRELHEKYGGQPQSGISTPADYNTIFLFTSSVAEEYGYHFDGWHKDNIFFYTGQGQVGDMSFSRGNKAIRDHIKNKKELHLFEYIDKGRVRYVDEMICTGFHFREAADMDEQNRRVIVFELISASEMKKQVPKNIIEQTQDLDELRTLAKQQGTYTPTAEEAKKRKTLFYKRSSAVRLYALRRADGYCESCDRPAPFTDKSGNPFLEVHHINRLSDGGPDLPDAVIAVCPNCHRRAHHAIDAEAFNAGLKEIILAKEKELQGN